MELYLFASAKDEKAAVAEILGHGIRAIVHKRGVEGASYFNSATRLTQPGFDVEELDPTGAGDCFGATFVSCWLRNMRPAQCLAYAAASGALAVTRQGPMEGAASQADLDAFLCRSFRESSRHDATSSPLVSERLTDGRAGVTSVCTAIPSSSRPPFPALRTDRRVLIEATCNQVNQEGGYTGMTPADFRRFVEGIAARVGLDPSQVILGGDHLGPSPWKHLPQMRLCNGPKQ